MFVTIGDGRLTGYGECIPTSLYYEPGHIGRADVDEWAELMDLCRGLPGQDARRLGRLIPDARRRYDANSVHDTVDFALHDLVGRRLGVPVAALLGGCGRPWVEGVPVIHVDTPQAMAERAAEMRRRWGFTWFKIKPIGTREADVETLARMREKMGPSVRYTMDANYALKITDPAKVADYMNELRALGLEIYEDPLDVDFAALRFIQERTPVRLMIDEHARTPEAVLRVIEARCARMINIHANWSGGFQPAIAKAALAHAAGMGTMIGSTRYIGPGYAAYQTMASVLPGGGLCEQVYGEVYGWQTLMPDPYEVREGRIYIRDASGLGVTPDMDAIAAITERKEVFE
jgi:L-alanine-DL-glutamate epimerase-like enolase superfamily enzyme